MKATLALAAVAGLTTMASAGPIIWDNGGPFVTSNGLSSQYAANYPFDSQTADDFMFEVDECVWDVHWWGVYWNGTPPWPNPIDFNIYFYATDPFTGQPQLDALGNPDPLDMYTVPVTGTVYGDPLNNEFEYHVDLPYAFAAAANTHYWMAIQAVVDFPPQWGWLTTDHPIQLSPAVQGFPLLGTPYWTTYEPFTDMAFYLTDIPSPGALALLGLAGLIGRRRR